MGTDKLLILKLKASINRSKYADIVADIVKAGRICLLLAFIPCFVSNTYAATPSLFTAEYEARYGGFKASAERSLAIGSTDQIEMSTFLRLKLFGKTISTINEKSLLSLDPQNSEFRSESYSFIQTGIGKRRRDISFDWESGNAKYNDGSNEITNPAETGLADSLTSYLEINKQVLAGENEIFFPVLDKGSIEERHFRVLEEEIISTRAGDFRTVKIERVREPDSERSTEMWLALDWDLLLVKMIQKEKGSRDISLELKQAVVNDIAVTGMVSEGFAEDEKNNE